MPPYENRPGWGKTGEHQMTTDCKHAHIQTWRFEDSAEVAGLWSCTDCGRRFEPVAPVVDHACTTSAVVDRVPLTDDQIKAVLTVAVRAGAVAWLGFEKDKDGLYTAPSLSPQHYQIARAIEAAHGITAAKDKP